MNSLPRPVFPAFRPHHAAVWGHAPVRIAHSLHEHELFSDECLARLLETYPHEHYSLVQWGEFSDRAHWREGDLRGLSGRAILEAVAKARVWINLRNVAKVDPRYATLLDAIAADIAHHVPGLAARDWTMGILISSPLSRTLYHADLPGQALLQIRGRKKLFVYPREAPFLRPQHLEGIALSGVEASIPYETWYDEFATQYPMAPGDMMHWPLNAPHRVDNDDCLNISVTIEYFTPEIRRGHMVNLANAILRNKLGANPRSRATSGPVFWAKRLLQRGLRNSAWLRREDKARRPPEFRLDPQTPGGIVDFSASASSR